MTMGEKTEAAGDELDVLKVYVWVMLVMSVALSVALWFMHRRVQTAQKFNASAQDKLVDFAAAKSEIVAMLTVYRDNNEDQARTSPNTWFSNVWRSTGIEDSSIKMGAWDNPPRYDNKGKYWEENIRIVIENRQPLTRQKVAEFCHEVERASTRLRILSLDLRRANKKEGLETDQWSGRITFGYRRARINE
jgi:hypothetical protein